MKVKSVVIVELDLEPVHPAGDIVEDIKVGNYYVAGSHSTWDEGLTPGRAYRIVEVGDDFGLVTGTSGLLEARHEFEIVNDSGKHAYMSRRALKAYNGAAEGKLMKEIEQ